MSSNPWPVTRPAPIAAPPNPLDEYGRMVALKNQQALAPLQQQEAQQQVQGGQMQLQQQQQDLNDQKGIQKWFMGIDPKDPNAFDPVEVGKTLANAGVSGKGIMSAQQQLLQHQQTAAALTKDQLANQQEMSNQLYSSVNGVIGVTDPQQRAQALTQLLPVAVQAKALTPQQAQQMSQNPGAVTDDVLRNFQHGLGISSAFLASVARKQSADTEQGRVAASMDPQSSLYAPTPASVAMGTAPGAAQIQANEVEQAGEKAGAEAKAKQPFELALDKQRQALSQGDPKAAAQLLVDGDATLAELKSRGATPDFITQSLAAAKELSGGKYNAQEADAQFDVAKSPANLGFFGSAKSLTDPGGTLDQLAAAAKDIPRGKFPIGNTVADWEKVATGSGPIAKYAATALLASDDAAKVIGGGVGSDKSREATLKIFNPALSPEQRGGTLEGVRGAVMSQINSRIGKNPVMQRMYGGSGAATQRTNTPLKMGVGSVITQNGHSYKVTAVDASGTPIAADPVN